MEISVGANKKQELGSNRRITGKAWTIKDVCELYHDYLCLKLGINRNDVESSIYSETRPIISKAKSNLSLFLKYVLENLGGEIGDALNTFERYSLFLSTQLEMEEITANRCSYLKMYATRYRKYPELKGFVVWINDVKIKHLKDKNTTYQIKGHPLVLEFAQWLKLRSKLNRESKYAKAATDAVSLFIRWVQENHNGEVHINAFTVNQYLNAKSDLALTTLNKYLDWIKLFCKFFMERFEKKTPPSRRDDFYHNTISEIKEILNLRKKEYDDTQVERIAIPNEHLIKMLNLADERMKMVIRLGSEMGLRASSMFALKVKDIDLNNKRMMVQLKGRNQPQVLPIPVSLNNMLATYFTSQKIKPEDKLLRFNGQEPATLSSAFNQFLKKNGLKYVDKSGKLYGISLHNLRHTFAYNSIDRFGLLMTSRLLCHKSVEVTERHYLKDKLTDALYKVYEMDEEEIKRMKEMW
ncbi:site-specific integrase [Limibacter armeniacum]|uniref:tyrosine-type recombinase/integrase n=1 Tax=Limibacter armeniacum TaxID=466084 RepID=UPI002FE6107D